MPPSPASVRASTLVVGGIGKSYGAAFSPSIGLPAVASEHTANGRIGTSHSAVHSLSDCDTSAMEGAKNNTALPAPACSSAIRRAVNVLPVPHAMISFPRSDSPKPARTFSTAVTWCGYSIFFAVSTSAVRCFASYWLQSIVIASSSSTPTRVTGIF